LYDYARRRIERFQVEPVKAEAEARACHISTSSTVSPVLTGGRT
jgi:hypothetical protein